MESQSRSQYYICSCYFFKNIFLEHYKLHVDYHSEEQLSCDYRKLLQSRGCSDQGFQLVVEEAKAEVSRRRQAIEDVTKRRLTISQCYTRLHPSVYTLSESFLDPVFLSIVKYCKSAEATRDGLLKLITSEKASRVYSLPVFTKQFCEKFVEELDNFKQNKNIEKNRPNTMNKTGILLSELGMDECFLNRFRTDYLSPVAALIYPECVGEGLDSHRAHIVTYTTSRLRDVGLSYHYDNAEVTLNVCLGKQFSEGELYIGKMKDDHFMKASQQYRPSIIEHSVSRGVLHRGQQMHGALEISEGERYNLIMWMRASSVRNKLCPRCGEEPDLAPSAGFGDGFTQLAKH